MPSLRAATGVTFERPRIAKNRALARVDACAYTGVRVRCWRELGGRLEGGEMTKWQDMQDRLFAWAATVPRATWVAAGAGAAVGFVLGAVVL